MIEGRVGAPAPSLVRWTASMAERNELDDAATRALLAAGKDAAKRAAFDLLSSDDEREAAEAERARTSKNRRWKLIAGGVLALFVVIGVVGMLVSYWPWFLLAGVLGFAGLFGWWRVKRRLAARGSKEPERIEVAPRAKEPSANADAVRRQAEERERDAKALAEARATDEQAVEDELEALKARVNRSRPGT